MQVQTQTSAHQISAQAQGLTYAIRTFGCQMNEHDSERISGLLESDGYKRADNLEDADVMVLNTCCIRENADNKLYGALGQLKAVKAQRPEALIAVAGCLAQKDRELVRQRAGHVDVVFGTHNVHRAAELIKHARRHGPIVEILTETARDDAEAFPSALPVRREAAHCAWVTIQIGCDNSCAFCIVPAVRGPEISRPFGELVSEIKALATEGVSEVTLLGQNVNSYGRDLALQRRSSATTADNAWWCGDAWLTDQRARPLFADLLREVGRIDGIRRVRFTSPHPKDLRSETIAAMSEVTAVCEHLHLPLQSGSDTVLRAMQRGYTAERYLQRLAAARAAVDDLAVSTDIIVGFPGETDDDFEQTLRVAAEARYDSAFTFIFSPRPGTVAADMTEKFVAHDVAVDRYERLRAVIERSSRLANEARIGKVEEIVIEGPSKKNPAVLSGRTRRNTLVHFSWQHDTMLQAGTYARVQVVAAAANFLEGALIDLEVPPETPTTTPASAPAPKAASQTSSGHPSSGRRLIPVVAAG